MEVKLFNKKRWKPFEEIIYIPDRHPEAYEGESCMLLAVDFEEQLMRLEPFDKPLNEDKSFWCRVEHCYRPHSKLKISK